MYTRMKRGTGSCSEELTLSNAFSEKGDLVRFVKAMKTHDEEKIKKDNLPFHTVLTAKTVFALPMVVIACTTKSTAAR